MPVRVTADFSEGHPSVVARSDQPVTPMYLDMATTPATTTIVTFSTSSSSSSVQPHIQQMRQDITEVMTVRLWSRGVSNLTDLWREYSVGLGCGPSIKDLNATRSNWFLPHDKNFHYRRMRIINGQEKNAADNGITIET